jgi:amidase
MPDAFTDATALAELVHRGEVSPLELAEEAIARIEKLNPELNAITIPLYDKARREAAAVSTEAPFAGVPYVIKDLTLESEGDPCTASIRGVKESGYRSARDSWFVERMRDAGFVLIGRANTPEMGIYETTEPEAWGPSANPWDVARASGASSGGSAAAVGSGMVPVAHGNDGAGSVRMPASLCGVVGLKPTRGRISVGPEILESDLVAGDAHEGLMAHSVRDIAAVLDVVSGHRPGDGYAAPTPVPSFAKALHTDPGRLRIGVLTHDPKGEVSVPEVCVTAARRAADALADAGHDVRDGYPAGLHDGNLPGDFLPVVAVAIMRELERFGRLIGRPITEADVEPYTWAVATAGKGVTGAEYAAGIDSLRRHARDIEMWWEEGWDILLSPTSATSRPPLLGRPRVTEPEQLAAITALFAGHPPEWEERLPEGGSVVLPDGDDDQLGLLTFTASFNVSGQPAITLPVHQSDEGFPIGVQLVAAYGRDDTLFQIATQVEAALPWADRRPPIAP